MQIYGLCGSIFTAIQHMAEPAGVGSSVRRSMRLWAAWESQLDEFVFTIIGFAIAAQGRGFQAFVELFEISVD